jgi:hypothetical protein
MQSSHLQSVPIGWYRGILVAQAAIAVNVAVITAVAQTLEPAIAADIIGTYGCAAVIVMFAGP